MYQWMLELLDFRNNIILGTTETNERIAAAQQGLHEVEACFKYQRKNRKTNICLL